MQQRRLLGSILVASIFLLSVYRALTQSLVFDEALSYRVFLHGPVEDLLQYEANNHILFNYFAKLSIFAFGVSEFSLRLPALLGTAGYLWVAVTISDRLFKRTGTFLLVLGLLTLNPLLLDLCCLSRGYVMALAFYFWGALFLLRSFEEKRRERSWCIASILFALSIWTNFTFGIICICTVAAYLAILDRRSFRKIAFLLVPGPVLLTCVLFPYLGKMHSGKFSAGFDTPGKAVLDLINASFIRFNTATTSLQAAYANPDKLPHTPWLNPYLSWAAWALVATLLLVTAGLTLKHRRSLAHRPFILFGGSLVLFILVYLGVHALLDLKYPKDRMVLFVIPIATLAIATSQLHLERVGRALGLIVLLIYVTEIDWVGSRTWSYDTGTKKALIALAEEVKGTSAPVHLGSQWLNYPSISVYRWLLRYSWLATNQDDMQPDPKKYDYFFYHPDDYPGLSREMIEKVVYKDPRSGMILAKVMSAKDSQSSKR